jgi:hypothetical protein
MSQPVRWPLRSAADWWRRTPPLRKWVVVAGAVLIPLVALMSATALRACEKIVRQNTENVLHADHASRTLRA